MGCCLLGHIPRTSAIIHKEKRIGNTFLRVGFGDLTCEEVDAVINLTDEFFTHRGGVPGALKRAGGLEITKECEAAVKKLGQGTVIVTSAGYMPCRKVIHIGLGGGMDVCTAIHLALTKADELHYVRVSMSGACAGSEHASVISVLSAVTDWIQRHKTSLREVRVVAWENSVVRSLESGLG